MRIGQNVFRRGSVGVILEVFVKMSNAEVDEEVDLSLQDFGSP